MLPQRTGYHATDVRQLQPDRVGHSGADGELAGPDEQDPIITVEI